MSTHKIFILQWYHE